MLEANRRIAHVAGLSIMRNENNRLLKLSEFQKYLIAEALPKSGVLVGGPLVEQKNLALRPEGNSHDQPLLLAL